MTIQVMVHFPKGENCRGSLSFTKEGPKLTCNAISNDNRIDDEVELSLIENESNLESRLSTSDRFKFRSRSVIRKYS
ncbi:MAG: hypothetical protein KAU48_05515, partial [Candidatus Thorarchaeota archaeon]|nr:hypothetical protein [Candidatus Thorarchaeota archaeon]